MSRSQFAILVAILLGIAAGTGSAVWWLHLNEKLPEVAKLETPATNSTPPSPTSQVKASRELAPSPPSAPTPEEALGKDQASSSAASSGQPSFDIVRVEPKGDTVVAGKGAPDSEIALMAGGKKIGQAKTDANGQFVILPPPLPPGDYALTLRQDGGSKPTESKQSVAVSVPQPGKGSAVVALAEPGKSTKLLSALPSSPAAAPLPPGKVAIASAELENGTGFYVTGTAAAGARVHVYLNDAHIAAVVAGSDGGWSVRVMKGLTGGHYVVRADVGGADGRVASRAEVPFDVPMAMAAAAQPPASAATASGTPTPTPAPPPSAATSPPRVAAAPSVATEPSVVGAATSSSAEAVVDSVSTTRVTAGDNLWNISRFRLGDGKRYTQIYAANAGQIRNPDLIYPGQVFVVPQR